MLARRRRRRQEARSAKAIEQTARDIVQAELDQWKQRVAAIQAERQEHLEHYTMVEQELRRHYDQACRQLEQRRDTLLATTSLIPYTQTIMQAATNFRVPAPLLTLQARLCLHVHCLCCHEELLLRTKEQGWDTIAWMEDVTQQLRLLTQKQVLLLKTKIINQIDKMKELNENVEIPEYIQETLQHVSSFDLLVNTTADGETTAMTPSSAQLLAQEAYPDPMSGSSQQQQGESFLDFLQRYEQRKEHRHKADQMRLAEFKSRDMRTPVVFTSTTSTSASQPSAAATNPYTSRRAGVGNKLKNYASTLFRASSTNISNSNTMMDESMQLEELNSSHVPRTSTSDAAGTGGIAEGGESTTSLASQERVNSATSRSSWLSSVKHRSASLLLPGPSSDAMDAGWSLGSSLRGLRRIGRKSLPPDLTMMTTQPEVQQEEEGQDDSQENLQQQQQQQQQNEEQQNQQQQEQQLEEQQDNEQEKQQQNKEQQDHDNSNTDLSSDTEQQLDDINLDDMAIDDQQNKDKSNGNHQEPSSSNGEQQQQPLATTDAADNADAAAADGSRATRQQTKTDAKPTTSPTMTSPASPTSHLSPLKEKLKAPVTMIHQHTKIKLAESAR